MWPSASRHSGGPRPHDSRRPLPSSTLTSASPGLGSLQESAASTGDVVYSTVWPEDDGEYQDEDDDDGGDDDGGVDEEEQAQDKREEEQDEQESRQDEPVEEEENGLMDTQDEPKVEMP